MNLYYIIYMSRQFLIKSQIISFSAIIINYSKTIPVFAE